MCYTLLLSTDSPADLSRHNDDLIAFGRELPGIPEARHLAYPHRWHVGSRTGCSCGFRHLHVSSVELGFGEPVDWFPEDPKDIAATIRFITIVNGLVAGGNAVDCVDAWPESAAPAALAGTIDVDLSRVDDRAFRFYEQHRFVFRAKSGR